MNLKRKYKTFFAVVMVSMTMASVLTVPAYAQNTSSVDMANLTSITKSSAASVAEKIKQIITDVSKTDDDETTEKVKENAQKEDFEGTWKAIEVAVGKYHVSLSNLGYSDLKLNVNEDKLTVTAQEKSVDTDADFKDGTYNVKFEIPESLKKYLSAEDMTDSTATGTLYALENNTLKLSVKYGSNKVDVFFVTEL